MAKVFLAISILFLIGAAGLGFVAKGKAEAKVNELRKANASLEDTTRKLADTGTKLKASQDELDASKKTVEEQKTQITDAEGKLTKATEEAKKAEDSVKEKETLLAAAQDELRKARELASATPVPGADKPAAVVALEAELTQAKTALAEANVAKEQFQARNKAAEENLVAAQKRVKQYEDRVAVTGLTGRVVAVNPGWNFVVIDVGDKQGATINSPLLVVRNGQRVANLKITSVEPRTSIADVVPGSIARGDFVQPGDRVVFAGTRGQPPAAPLSPAGASAGIEAPQPVTALPN